ncbi:MAG: TRAP transporter small permease subunit, partial [Candidatus Adiutrix sp.]|nr:TRAP transporter small permease subunit [Candidatus Adiutrix sp.]
MDENKSPLGTALHVVDRVVYHIEEKSIAVSVLLLAAILIGNVALRLFNSSLASTEELSQFLMFFITFLGTSYAARMGMHIRMSMLNDLLKGRAQKILAVVVSLGTAVVLFYVAYLSLRYVVKIASLNRVSPILQWPVQYVWIVMPVGLFLAGVMVYFPKMDPMNLTQQMLAGVKPLSLVAAPMFIFAADIISSGQAARRLTDLVLTFFGHIRGGLAITAVAACTVFGAVSGSCQATVVAIGG